MALILGCHHVALYCSGTEKYEETVAFYRDVLEIPVKRTWKGGTMLDAGGTLLELFETGAPEHAEGVVRHFALATGDVDACAAAVTAAGYEVFMEPHDIVIASEPPFPARIAFCYGPMGEQIEFFCEK